MLALVVNNQIQQQQTLQYCLTFKLAVLVTMAAALAAVVLLVAVELKMIMLAAAAVIQVVAVLALVVERAVVDLIYMPVRSILLQQMVQMGVV